MEYLGVVITLILILLSGSFWVGKLSNRINTLEDTIDDVQSIIKEHSKEYVVIKVKLASIEALVLLIKENQERK